jgi:hypothetical protein
MRRLHLQESGPHAVSGVSRTGLMHLDRRRGGVSGGIKGSRFRRVKGTLGTAWAVSGQTTANAARVATKGRICSQPKSGSAHRPTSRAVSRNRSRAGTHVFVVRLDGLDHEIELVGAVDFAGDAVGLAWGEDPGFGEVVQPVNPSRRIVLHELNLARACAFGSIEDAAPFRLGGAIATGDQIVYGPSVPAHHFDRSVAGLAPIQADRDAIDQAEVSRVLGGD